MDNTAGVQEGLKDKWLRPLDEQAVERRQEQKEVFDRYRIEIPPEVAAGFDRVIAGSSNPEDTAYRIGTALRYAEMIPDMSFEEAYARQDELNRAYFGGGSRDAKGNFEAVCDAWRTGNLSLRQGDLGMEIMNAEAAGDEEALKVYTAELEAINAELAELEDTVPRGLLTEAFKNGLMSAPFTLRSAGTGIAVGLLNPALGSFASFMCSSAQMTGQEYLKLREEGASPEAASKAAAISGALQGLVETSLGDVAGFAGAGLKAAGRALGRNAVKSIAQGAAKRFALGGGVRLAGHIAGRYALEVGTEGLEEAVQELVSIATSSITAEIEGYDFEKPKADEIIRSVSEAFRGGVLGSLVLSGVPMAVNTAVSIADYRAVRQTAVETDSEEAFRKSVEDSPVFSAYEGRKKEDVIRNVWESYRRQREERNTREAQDLGEVTGASEGMEGNATDAETGDITAAGDEYREDGRLFTQNDVTEDGGSFRTGNPEKESENLYGYINYRLDGSGNRVEITDFKMTASREALREEFYDSFAEEFAGYDIVWNPKGKTARDIKARLEKASPSRQGLNYYTSVESVADAKTRTRVAAELKKYMPRLDDRQRAGAVSLLDAMAAGQGKSISSYVRETFGSSIFGDVSEVEALAQAQGSTFQGKAGATTWKRFGDQVKAVIYAGEKADFSTWAHELAHVYQWQLEGEMKAQAESAFNVKDGDWTGSTYTFSDGRSMSSAEAFAYGFQDWLETGKAPNEQLKGLFERFAEFLARCYNALKNHFQLSDDVRQTYEKMLAGDGSLLAKAEEAVWRQNMEQRARERTEAVREAETSRRTEEAKAAETAETTVQEAQEEERAPAPEAEPAEDTRAEEARAAMPETPGAEALAETITSPDTTVAEKNGAVMEGAGTERAFEDMLFQLAGLKGVKQIARAEEKQKRLLNLKTAVMMEEKFRKQGLPDDVAVRRIKRDTNWERNASGQWVYETDDSAARIRNRAQLDGFLRKARAGHPQQTMLIGEVLDHPELFEMYPWLRDLNVIFFNDKTPFRSGIGEHGIMLNTRYLTGTDGETGIKGSLLHEMQHIVQSFEVNGNVEIDVNNIRSLWEGLQALVAGRNTPATDEVLGESLGEYIRAPEEVDARNVAMRLAYNADRRRNTPLPVSAQEYAERKSSRGILFQNTEEDEVRMKYAGSDSWMKAPNGKDTKLTEKQWLQVRTPSFKAWFGDWENETEIENGNVSFFTDENGEPKVFYHGSKSRESFDIFDIEQFGKNDAGWMGEGFYFSGEFAVAAGYNSGNIPLFEVFLNSKEPYFMSDEEHDNLVESDDINTSREFSDNLKEDGYDGVWFNGDLNQEAVVFNPNQIKSATDNNGEFNANNPSILFQKAYHGSPYGFDSFSTDAIGSGEGMQAFGWGLYFTNNRGIAEGYAKKLAKLRVRYKGEDTETAKRRAQGTRTAEEIEAGGKSTEELTLGFIERMARNKALGLISDYKENIKKQIEFRENSLEDKASPLTETEKRIYRKQIEALRNIDPEQIEIQSGQRNLYTVDIPDGDYIKWDGPLTEGQKRKITEQARKEGVTDGRGNPFAYEMDGEWVLNTGAASSGEIFYRMELRQYFPDDKARSLFLARAGIKGIDYPAGSLSGGAEGRNFVVFDDRDVQVQSRILFQREASLLGIHNLSADNIRHALKMGGLANPSVAVINTDIPEGFGNFGEITLIAATPLLDKRTGRNAGIFGADIYSPRYPQVDVEVTNRGMETLKGIFSAVGDKALRGGLARLAAEALGGRINVARRSGLSVAYALEKGASVGSGEAYRANTEAMTWIEGQGLEKDFAAWAEEKLSGVEKRERIFAGFTPSGSRRYVPHTLENVSRMMKKQGLRSAEGFNYGMGNARALVAPKWTTTGQAAKHKGQIVDPETFKKAKAALEEKFSRATGILGEGGDWDLGADRIVEALESGRDIASFAEEEYGLKLSAEDKALLSSIRQELEALPTEYFEVKFERPVDLSEFFAAVIPADTPQDVREALENAGLEIREYAEGERAKTVAEYARERSGGVRLLFQQTEKELLDDAASFDSWQDFMEFYESFGKPEDSIVPSGADEAWYRTAWELARKRKADRETEMTAEDRDALFIREMEDGGLEDFLTEADRVERAELWQPSTEEETAEIESLSELKDRVRTVMAHGSWLSNARRVADGKELTPSTRKRLMTLLKEGARDYRALYAELSGREDLAVGEGETVAAEIRKKYRLADPDGSLERRSPEERRRIAAELENRAVAERIRSGEMPMDGEIQRYIDSLEKETRKAERAYKKLEAETREDWERISGWESRQLLKEHEKLLEAQEKSEGMSAEIRRKVERGIRITERERREADRLKASYETVFRKFEALRRSISITEEVRGAIGRREDLLKLREEFRAKEREKRLLEEEKRIRTSLVKRAMRKVDFGTVDYSKGRVISAIQQLFEPNLTGGVNRWLGTEGAGLRETAVRWKTDAEWKEGQERILSRRRNGKAVIAVLNDKPYEKWTKGDREAVWRAFPRTDWVKELDLESLAEGRMRIDFTERTEERVNPDGSMETRTELVPDPELEAEIREALGDGLYSMLAGRPFAEWTTAEMEQFAVRMNELFSEGREELLAKNLLRRQRADRLRREIDRVLQDTGVVINPDDPEPVKERKRRKIARILGEDPSLKGTAAGAERKDRGRVNRLVNGYGAARLRSVTRILDGWKDGVNTRELYFRENEAYNTEMRSAMARKKKIAQVLEEQKISMRELFRKVEIPGLVNGQSVSFTVDELLFFREAAKDERSRAAVAYGNIGSSELFLDLKMRCAAMDENNPRRPGTKLFREVCDGALDKILEAADSLDIKFTKLAEAIAGDYAEQYERMNRVSIEEWNRPVNRVDNYVPLVRLESNGDTNENRVREDLLGINGMGQAGVDRGMTKGRIDISPLHQKPVETGLYKTWADSVDRTEHFIAYSGYVREMNRVYRSRDAQLLRQRIEGRYGRNMLRYIDEYIDETANPGAVGTASDLDRIIRTLRGKTAPAYLSWKLSTILKQMVTSPPPFFQFVNPVQYTAALFDIIRSKGGLFGAIREKSVFMASRVMDPMNELVDEQLEKARSLPSWLLGRANKLGMKGLEMADWVCVAPGWLACYRKKLAELEQSKTARYGKIKAGLEEANGGLEYGDPGFMTADMMEAEAGRILEEDTERQAVDWADDCVRMCQPSARGADIAPLFKGRQAGSELAKAFLQFQTALNVIWNNIRYDIPYAVRNRNFMSALSVIGAYTVAGILVGAVAEGLPDDDEDKDALKQLVFFGTTQFTDAVPVIGSELTNLMRKGITGESGFFRNGTDLTPMAGKFIQAAQNLSAGEWEKALSRAAEGAALFTGLPVSGAKELTYVLTGEPGISALWGRRE